MNIKQFLELDSRNRDKDGNEMPHEEKYTKIVEAIGLNHCFMYVPATEEEIIQALKTDRYLNNIPIEKWDRQRPYISAILRHIGITHHSLAECNCILKQAARMQAARKVSNEILDHIKEYASTDTN